MKGDYMYHYVTNKAFLNQSYGLSADLLNQLKQELEKDGIIAHVATVGSKRRGLITQNAQNPIDYDFNLWIDDAGEYTNARELKNEVIDAFKYILEKNGLENIHVQDSTSVITTGKIKMKGWKNFPFAIDICIVKEDAWGKWNRLIHNKTGSTQYDTWIWNNGPNGSEIQKKEKWLKPNYWNEVREVYLDKKNMYLKRNEKRPSFECYIETINEVYDRHNRQNFVSSFKCVQAQGWKNENMYISW